MTDYQTILHLRNLHAFLRDQAADSIYSVATGALALEKAKDKTTNLTQGPPYDDLYHRHAGRHIVQSAHNIRALAETLNNIAGEIEKLGKAVSN